MRRLLLLSLVAAVAASCADGTDSEPGASPAQGASGASGAAASAGAAGETAAAGGAITSRFVKVTVTLDGAPTEGITVLQGGSMRRTSTAADGTADVEIDPAIVGERHIMASHPDARIRDALLEDDATAAVTIALTRFSRIDNEAYAFSDPGEPGHQGTTAQCGHCHPTILEGWHASPHRKAASNPTLHDLYTGTASSLDAAGCADRGGQMREALVPGSDEKAPRCHVGEGVLPALNPGCEGDTGCSSASAFGGCADCHAPGIDGKLGGRDLRDARGISFKYGVHCDVCHKVESIDLAAPAGNAGRLKILRPSEPSPSKSLGPFLPIAFGPYDDVSIARVGSVARKHFHEATLCAGCHQLEQPALAHGATLDKARWPTGLLPIHTTYAEWLAGPSNPAAPCQSCHMPPAPGSLNSIDLQHLHDVPVDSATGWPRPPGSVKHHTWVGPRTPESNMLRLAAWLSLDTSLEGDELVVRATVKNVGAGHAIPTGEPLRSLLLRVEASCPDGKLTATGGDVVPDFGGYRERRTRAEGLAAFSGARVGDVVRVVKLTGKPRDYEGFGPFGDGSFTAAQKGIPEETLVAELTVTATTPALSFNRPLPDGDVAYLGDPAPAPGAAASPLVAGAPGFAFARVLSDAQGRRMAPHFAAADVVSDNRLLPGRSFTTTHRFASRCTSPVATATLVHRAYPPALAAQRGWLLADSPMAEASR